MERWVLVAAGVSLALAVACKAPESPSPPAATTALAPLELPAAEPVTPDAPRGVALPLPSDVDTSAIEQTLLEFQLSLEGCFEQAEQAGETVPDEIEVLVRLRADGSVVDLAPQATVRAELPVLWACIDDRMRRWPWPRTAVATSLSIRPADLAAADDHYNEATRAIEAVVLANQEQVFACYRGDRSAWPEQVRELLITVVLFVDPDGRASPALVVPEELDQPLAQTCATSAIRAWTMPRPSDWQQGRMVVQVDLPIE